MHLSYLPENKHPVLIFDGVCNLCEALVIFIVKRDKNATFRFITAQSEVGQRIQKQIGVDAIRNTTMILLKNGQIFTQSDAAIEVAKGLDGPWKLLTILVIIPRPLRDRCYSWIGKNRYTWFGSKDQCLLPTKELESRFIKL
jgi:predicted DCC family thiol-disulfide oxidoreductase YuxK